MDEYLVKLTEFISTTYGLAIRGITAAKRGFFGETWELETPEGKFFVKIDYWDYHKELYRSSFETVAFLRRRGIDFILHPINTLEGRLCCDFEAGVLGVFVYVEGENREDYPISLLFEKLAQIYRVDAGNHMLKKDLPDMAVLEKLAELYKKVAAHRENYPSAPKIIALMEEKKAFLMDHGERLRLLARRCQNKDWNVYITHGDAGGNCILTEDAFTIIDWDDPRLAPPERDAWFFIQDFEQIHEIDRVFEKEGLSFRLDIDRLCYYCYRSLFHYICEYLMAYLAVDTEEKRAGFAGALEGYFSSWVMKALAVADGITDGTPPADRV